MTYLTRGPEALIGSPPILRGAPLHSSGPSPDEHAVVQRSAPQTRSSPPAPTWADVQIVRDAMDVRGTAMAEALAHRANPAVGLTERSKPYLNMGLIGAARSCLEEQGVRTVNMSNIEIAERALKQRSQHSTSDFPLLLEGGARTAAMMAYKAIPKTFQAFARRDDFRDYRPRTRVQTSIPTLPKKVPQGGQYNRGTFVESGETDQLAHEGIILGLTIQAIANDNVGAFAQIPLKFAAASALAESRDFYAHLCGNPLMGDGVALFNTTSRGASGGNTAAGSLANTTALKAAWKWMRLAKDAGNNPIMVIPKFLVVASSLEVDAEALFSATYTATAPSGVNPFDGRGGIAKPIIIGDPHIDAYGSETMHFLIADPNITETVVYGYLQGREGPQVDAEANFYTGGIDFKLTNNFGVKAAEWRSMYRFT